MTIAFFGMGLLGSNFVRALKKRGEEVNVWNRTFEKAKRLEEAGAKAFEDPAKAAEGATRVHLTLSDDAAVDSVLAKIPAGTTVVDHTTTTASGALARCKQRPGYVHAPVFMGPQNALESTGIMLVSGDRARVDPLRAHLAAMTGKLVDLGERPDAAASFKLLGNMFLMFLNAGFADMLMLAKALDVSPQRMATLFDHFNPGMTLKARLDRTIAGTFETPSWELSMARKDARLMMEEAARAKRTLGVLPEIAARMDDWIAKGHGGHDWTVVAKDAL